MFTGQMLSPDIHFDTLLPLIGAIFSFSFGIFVWLKSPRNTLNWIFLAFCIAITYWLFGTFEMNLNRGDIAAAVFWDRFVYLGVVFVPSLMHHFSLAITGNKGQRKLLIFGYIYSFVFLAVSRTEYFVSGLNVFPNLVHSQAQIGHHIFLGIFFPLASLMFYNLWTAYQRSEDKRLRSALLLTGLGYASILLIGGTAYLPAYGIDIGYPFSYFSGILFVAFLASAIAEFQLFSKRVLVAEMFVFLTALILTANLLIARETGELVFSLFILGVFLRFGPMTVGVLNKEIAQGRELKILASALEKANVHLKEMDEAKTEFISIASHQLRTPVSVIKGYLSLMQEGAYGPLPKPIADKIDQMYVTNERLVHLINNILNMSRIEKNRLEFHCGRTDLDTIIKEVVFELALKAREKSITLEYVPPAAALPTVIADAEKVHEVIVNLLDNAIKYTPNGSIVVRVGKQNDGGKDWILVTVTDTGSGISAENRKRLFEKFYRADTPGTPWQTGTGLGLFICRRFMEAMGGKIELIESVSGQGSVFGVWLPIDPGGECAT